MFATEITLVHTVMYGTTILMVPASGDWARGQFSRWPPSQLLATIQSLYRVINFWVGFAREGRKKKIRTCDDDGTILPSDINISIGHFVQTCDVGALRSDDARETGAIGKHEETDVGRRLGLFNRLPDRVFGLVDARLVAGLQSPSRVAVLGVGVIFDDLPIGLGDGIFGIVDARRLCCRVRGTRGLGRSGRVRGRLSFHTEMAKSAEDGALRRHGVVVLQWDSGRVRYSLRRCSIGDLRLQRREHGWRSPELD
jgi:hypothetical protein